VVFNGNVCLDLVGRYDCQDENIQLYQTKNTTAVPLVFNITRSKIESPSPFTGEGVRDALVPQIHCDIDLLPLLR
jgi:hypothetical protein